VAAYPRAALRVPAALRSNRCRKCVIAPPTESRRWPETPGSVRQSSLGGICWCRPLRSKRPASARSLVPTASVDATGVGRFVGSDRFRTRTRVLERSASEELPEEIGRQIVGPTLHNSAHAGMATRFGTLSGSCLEWFARHSHQHRNRVTLGLRTPHPHSRHAGAG
jgi:hypothetical protein